MRLRPGRLRTRRFARRTRFVAHARVLDGGGRPRHAVAGRRRGSRSGLVRPGRVGPHRVWRRARRVRRSRLRDARLRLAGARDVRLRGIRLSRVRLRHVRLRPFACARGRIARAGLRGALGLRDARARVDELHVAHRPAVRCARVFRRAHRPHRIVRRHGGLHDGRARAGHSRAALREVRGELIVVGRRHGRVARGDDRALRDGRGRPVRGVAQRAGEALPHRRHARRARADVRVAPLLRIDLLREARHRLTVDERGGRHGGHRVRRAEVHVRVVNVRDVRDVRHVHRLVDVDVVDVVHDHGLVHVLVIVRAPAAPARPPWVARAEREPCHARRRDAADREAHAPVEAAAASADERDERGRVAGRRADDERTRHPGPRVVDVRPTAVMVRCEAPRLVVDPGPAPRRLPDPVAGAVRRPAGGHRARHPYFAVVGVLPPRSVRIEILVAGDFARHVARRHRALLGRVAARHPLVEAVGRRHGARVRDLQRGAREDDPLAGRHRHLRAVAVDGRAAAPHGDGRARAVGRDVDTIVSGRADREREVRRVDFIRRAGRQLAHMRRQRAERHLQLRVRIVEIEDRQARRLAEPHRGRADVQLGARARIVPELVARRERAVDGCVRPVARARGLGRHRARQVVQARDAARRIAARLPGDTGGRRRDVLRDGGRQRGEHRDGDERMAGDACEREWMASGKHGHRCLCLVRRGKRRMSPLYPLGMFQ